MVDQSSRATSTSEQQAVPVAQEVEPLSLRLAVAEVASCSCDTKTDDPRYHEGRCLYRVLRDARAGIERLSLPCKSGEGAGEVFKLPGPTADELEAAGKAPWQGEQPIEQHAKQWRRRPWVPLEAAISELQFWQRRDYEHGRALTPDASQTREAEFLAEIHKRTPTGAWIAVQHYPDGDWSVAEHPLPWLPGGEVAVNATRDALQTAWDRIDSLPPLEFSEDECREFFAALNARGGA